MREEVRKGGDDEMKVELSKHKLADFKILFSCSPTAAQLSEKWPSFTITNQRAEWRSKDILVVA
jgi:hypothetical protein